MTTPRRFTHTPTHFADVGDTVCIIAINRDDKRIDLPLNEVTVSVDVVTGISQFIVRDS